MFFFFFFWGGGGQRKESRFVAGLLEPVEQCHPKGSFVWKSRAGRWKQWLESDAGTAVWPKLTSWEEPHMTKNFDPR